MQTGVEINPRLFLSSWRIAAPGSLPRFSIAVKKRYPESVTRDG